MCKKIKDILFPTNLFGKKIVCKQFVLPDNNADINVYVEWTGDRLQMTYTSINKDRLTKEKKITPVTITRVNNGLINETIPRGNHGNKVFFIGNDETDGAGYNVIYFKCTNCTQLEVNGEIII